MAIHGYIDGRGEVHKERSLSAFTQQCSLHSRPTHAAAAAVVFLSCTLQLHDDTSVLYFLVTFVSPQPDLNREAISGLVVSVAGELRRFQTHEESRAS